MVLVAGSASAQPTTVAPGEIRCVLCTLTGQKPAPGAFDTSQIEFVANSVAPFQDGQTVRINVLARVLHPAPLVVEVLDSRSQLLDRRLDVVAEDPDNGRDPATCKGPERIGLVDLASKPVVSALKINDLVTGGVMMRRDERRPESLAAGTPILTNVRKVSRRIRFFHPKPIPDHCVNRSGRLIVHEGSPDGETTIVYNDGAVYHRNGASATFTREKLSAAELSGLMREFRAANFDRLATTFPADGPASGPALTLIGARYQRVTLAADDARLTAIVKRLDRIAAKVSAASR
jgi:hypothetical protein